MSHVVFLVENPPAPPPPPPPPFRRDAQLTVINYCVECACAKSYICFESGGISVLVDNVFKRRDGLFAVWSEDAGRIPWSKARARSTLLLHVPRYVHFATRINLPVINTIKKYDKTIAVIYPEFLRAIQRFGHSKKALQIYRSFALIYCSGGLQVLLNTVCIFRFTFFAYFTTLLLIYETFIHLWI